ncbi:hypothetical protein [Lacticaseibacillus yichunensis]|uniref:Uncharacterized protein n=1 Tax=Lacticaseibacillus yichunensis TaxID=2486015 RepID=A0ABW4CQC5_9LACO|nr:hypothetical protein [Lacticaseibacillus yichunensis]
MLIALWGSWLLLYLIARVVGALITTAIILLAAVLPGDRETRFQRLAAKNGRGLMTILAVALVAALVATGFIAVAWFRAINFYPVWIAVFGAVGICALTWGMRFFHSRQDMIDQLSHWNDDGDE